VDIQGYHWNWELINPPVGKFVFGLGVIQKTCWYHDSDANINHLGGCRQNIWIIRTLEQKGLFCLTMRYPKFINSIWVCHRSSTWQFGGIRGGLTGTRIHWKPRFVVRTCCQPNFWGETFPAALSIWYKPQKWVRLVQVCSLKQYILLLQKTTLVGWIKQTTSLSLSDKTIRNPSFVENSEGNNHNEWSLSTSSFLSYFQKTKSAIHTNQLQSTKGFPNFSRFSQPFPPFHPPFTVQRPRAAPGGPPAARPTAPRPRRCGARRSRWPSCRRAPRGGCAAAHEAGQRLASEWGKKIRGTLQLWGPQTIPSGNLT